MTKSFNNLYKEILNNRNLNENIPEFFDMTFDKYYTYSTVRLALHYYSFYEMYNDDKENYNDQLSNQIFRLNTIIKDCDLEYNSSKEQETYVKQIDELRSNIIKRVEMLSIYADLFDTYEYALSRVEYRFTHMDEIYDEEEFAKEVLRFAFDSEDNVMINNRIREIIGQLPVRITREKYFDYIRVGLYGLLGAQENIIETYTYLIRSAAMLNISEEFKDAYSDLWESKEKLEKISFKDITKDEYEAANQLVSEAVLYLESEVTAYLALMEVINELYAVLVCVPNTNIEEGYRKRSEAALYIMHSINDLFISEMNEAPSKDILSRFEIIEGFQEELEYDLISIEDILYQLDKQHRSLLEEINLERTLNSLLRAKSLLSDSLFIDLQNPESTEAIDKEKLQQTIDTLIQELSDKFQGMDRMIIRTIMANTISKIPVFFNKHAEVMEYVIYSLKKCSDIAEKYASMEIIEDIMAD